MGTLAWDNNGACILKYACHVQLHQFACSGSLFIWVILILFGLRSFLFVIVWLRLLLPFFMISFFFFFFLFEGINWCFVSYSFVSVKGPGRKLSLPTDLKTDLGTVGESQQFILYFLWVLWFLLFSCFPGFYVALVVFYSHSEFLLSVSLSLSTPAQTAHETVRLKCVSIFPLNVFWFDLNLLYSFLLHFASVYKGDL